jgi:hypothetical protein
VRPPLTQPLRRRSWVSPVSERSHRQLTADVSGILEPGGAPYTDLTSDFLQTERRSEALTLLVHATDRHVGNSYAGMPARPVRSPVRASRFAIRHRPETCRRQDRARSPPPRRPNYPKLIGVDGGPTARDVPPRPRGAERRCLSNPLRRALSAALRGRIPQRQCRRLGMQPRERAGSPSRTEVPRFRHVAGNPSSFPPTSTYEYGARSTDCQPGSTTRP